MIAFVFLCVIKETKAIYKEDVGVLDFSVATAGHGAVGWVHAPPSSVNKNRGNLVLTTDIPTTKRTSQKWSKL